MATILYVSTYGSDDPTRATLPLITVPVGAEDSHADLKLVAENQLKVGSFYELIPPTGDIHRVITTSADPSISLHLLGNDVGCVLRHRFEPATGEVTPFRTGYTNQDCQAD